MLLVSFLSIPPFVFIVDGILHIVLFFCSLDVNSCNTTVESRILPIIFSNAQETTYIRLYPCYPQLPSFPAPQPMSFNNVNSWCFFTLAG